MHTAIFWWLLISYTLGVAIIVYAGWRGVKIEAIPKNAWLLETVMIIAWLILSPLIIPWYIVTFIKANTQRRP